jgi:hypothetical protein
MAVTAEAIVTRIFALKLSALKRLCLHLGMMGPYTGDYSAERIEKFGPELPVAALLVASDEGAHPINRAAASLLVEFFVPNWRSYVPPEIVGLVVDRDSKEVREWRAAVLKRDGFKCVECGETDGLHAHHIARWSDFPSLRVIIDNGVTLCADCHLATHGGHYGRA